MDLKKIEIGVVGAGFVGNAVIKAFEKKYVVNVLDTIEDKCTHYCMSSFLNSSDIIFVCVPTPMGKDGECNTSIVEGIIKEISENQYYNEQFIVIKSTVIVGTTKKLQKQYPNLNLFFNPEFLTEANAVQDYQNQSRVIIGYEKGYASIYDATMLRQVFINVFGKLPYIITNTKTAEMVKYTTNSYLASKVSFANEINNLCQLINIDYDEMMGIAQCDKRLGDSHWQVPGPDGYKGYGGTCFPKDLSALTHYAEGLGLNPLMLKATAETNLEVRLERKSKKSNRQTEKV